MAEINFALLQPVDTGAQVLQGFNTGMAMVKQVQTRSALSSYLQNPDDPQAYNALAYFDPSSAATLQNQRLQQRKELLDQQILATRRAAGAQVASGDLPGAVRSAAGAGDFDLVNTLNKMSDDQRKEVTDRYVNSAPLAYQAAKLPYESRKEYLQNSPELKALGWTDEQLSSFDPTDENLSRLIGVGSKLSELQSADKPQYLALQPGGSVAAVGGNQPSRLVIAPNPGDQAPGTPVVPGGAAGKNNPGALKDTHGNFMSFATPAEGVAAQEHRLSQNYIGAGFNTVRKIVERYAPRGPENSDASVNNYITHVASRLGVNPDDALAQAVVPKLASAMREFETGHMAASPAGDKTKIRADALEAIALGANPERVKAAAAAHGVTI